ncbi:TetR/AcrR family transcriptional regulator [Pedobacter foliorum]|uniref:TetR/AcrR family transcriptional regulator n=1 Tax=Pedobacter foliorum TaxID=2739058 RepID=UPI0015675619|nr:TetR/AcrR family transcriptional regulator [Pedobacter foliorum]NRF37594.1 TetR/AcrR family transcriptional regulator [Pedobacter foliorum]
MAKRPRQKGIKNKPATMREFISAVGNILKLEGHTGLRVNRIARYSGRNRSLIGRYFSGLAGLQRAYIMEKDYWIPFFKRFVLTDADGIAEIKETFTSLMQENFRFFLNNPEMQNIILWQISESNELMTEISTNREIAGENLFKVTDPYFADTNVNFRAVIGLLLGGIYYMVLHARTNKSVVSGIDLNEDLDQVELSRTIEQIIVWACTAANNKETIIPTIPMMNYQFELLDTVVAQLSDRTDPTGTADLMLKNECKKLKRSIPNQVLSLTNETQIRSYLKMVTTKLSEAADLLYNPERKLNPDAELIVDVLKGISRHYFDTIPNEVILPKLFCLNEAITYNQKWQRIKEKLGAVEIDPFLIDVVYVPFNRLTLPDLEVNWHDYKYLKMYAFILESETAELVKNEQDLFELLIGLGYNHTRFSAYYTNKLKKSFEGFEPLGKLTLLEQQLTAIGQTTSRTLMSYCPNKATVVEDLNKWIVIELKKGEGTPVGLGEEIFDNSLNTVLTTSELSCWQKLQYDAGIYSEVNVDVFTGKVSANFKTKRGMRPSSNSVKSKLYGKEREIYKSLQPYVNKMKEDIDRFLM